MNTSAELITFCKENEIPLEIYTFYNNESEFISMDRYITGATTSRLMAGKVLHDNEIAK